MAFKLFQKGVKMIKIFASIGVIATFIFAVAAVAVLTTLAEEAAEKRRYQKKLKSRFKGGPTAKCFCKDCVSYCERCKPDKYNHGAGDCRVHAGRRVQDNWYCWSATPIEYDEAKKERRG